jgi:2-polyprenyl-3-methyl-5-hydroxy-6-metoxy-1,4-benzoquinol methylase
LSPFGPDYVKCGICGTLVTLSKLQAEKYLVQDDDTDYYGKNYWLDHQKNELGIPDIYRRSRDDLTERNLHWLKALLKFCTPPAKVLELGCSHGSFVALMRQAGYDASGVEMSPWVVSFGEKTFGVPIYVGPIEDLEIPLGSLDVIVLMDVLEHLYSPLTTMAICLKLLKPNGLLLIQTPQFKEGINYSDLVDTKSRFLEMLIPDEHIYLFSERSVTRMFNQIGGIYIQFEQAIFSSYDMFFVVSSKPIKKNETELIESTLLKTPNGRIALAMLDLRERELNLIENLKISEEDRLARWEQIQTLTALIKRR